MTYYERDILAALRRIAIALERIVDLAEQEAWQDEEENDEQRTDDSE